MKQQASPLLIVIAVALLLVALGGLYYRFAGPGSESQVSEHASPYMLKPGQGFQTPPPGGSGRNAITGEPLTAAQEPAPIGVYANSPRLPGGGGQRAQAGAPASAGR